MKNPILLKSIKFLIGVMSFMNENFLKETFRKLFFKYNKPLNESFKIKQFNSETVKLAKIPSKFFILSAIRKEVFINLFISRPSISDEKKFLNSITINWD